MDNLVISNQQRLDELKKNISADGAKSFFVATDFESTLTTAFVGGKKLPSLLAVLRNGNYLSPDYALKANELYNKYHPIEINMNIDHEERKRKMREWWETHFNLLVESGLNKKHVEAAVKAREISLRPNSLEFFAFLQEKKIPLVIVSSCGLGEYGTSLYLKENGILSDNVHIISNKYNWDDGGNATGIKGRIITSANKDEVVIQDFNAFQAIKDKANILLLGDTLDDIGMVMSLNYANLLKVGFLNENVEDRLDDYKEKYDVVLLNDAPMDFVNSLVKEIIVK